MPSMHAKYGSADYKDPVARLARERAKRKKKTVTGAAAGTLSSKNIPEARARTAQTNAAVQRLLRQMRSGGR